jgi:hypothetical protein
MIVGGESRAHVARPLGVDFSTLLRLLMKGSLLRLMRAIASGKSELARRRQSTAERRAAQTR